jgi:hypothetical protein
MTVHKGEAFQGEHEAIVAEELWDQVQVKLANQGQGGSSRKVSARTGVLAGLIYNAEGTPMVLTHTQKGNRRFHYYANRYEALGDSNASRVNARDIEDIVVGQLSQTLELGIQVQSVLLDGTHTAGQLHNAISRCRQLGTELTAAKYIRKQAIIRNVLDRVELHEDRVVIKIDNRSLLNAIGAEGAIQPSSSDLIIEREAIKMRRGRALRLIIPATSAGEGMSLRDDKLVTLLAESSEIMNQIMTKTDKSVPTLAAEQGRCRVRMMKVAKLVCLDPYIVTAIVEGRQPLNLSPSKLLAADLPLAWPEQRRVLGFS